MNWIVTLKPRTSIAPTVFFLETESEVRAKVKQLLKRPESDEVVVYQANRRWTKSTVWNHTPADEVDFGAET